MNTYKVIYYLSSQLVEVDLNLDVSNIGNLVILLLQSLTETDRNNIEAIEIVGNDYYDYIEF